MINETLLILMEECAETIQAISKCQRFGLVSTNPLTSKRNIDQLTQEIGDLTAMIEILIDQNCIDRENVNKAKANKKEKLKQWSNISHTILNN